MAASDTKQRMTVSGSVELPADFFKASEEAAKMRAHLDKAEAEIAKAFPGFKFEARVARINSGGRPRKGSAAAAAAAGATPPANGAGANAPAA